MSSIKITFYTLVILCLISPLASAKTEYLSGQTLRFSMNVSPVTNLAYQLDCMAGFHYCSKNAFQILWKNQLQWSKKDEEALGQWKGLRETYWKEVEIENINHITVGFPLRHEGGVDLRQKFRLASFQAQNLEEYQDNLELLLRPQDTDKAMQIIHYFWPRFHRWWQSGAAKQTEQFMTQFIALMQQKSLVAYAERVAHFYEAHLPTSSTIDFHFIFRPKTQDGGTNGEQIENHAVIETLEGETPEQRVDVVLHELFHYFDESSPPDRYAELVKGFIQTDQAYAMAAYNLLNESLATALGNGLVTKQLAPPERFQQFLEKENSLYNDFYIDQMAKEMLPFVEQWIKEGKTLYAPAFVPHYLQAAAWVFGEQLNPQLLLRTMIMIYDGKPMRPLVQHFQHMIRAGIVMGGSPIDHDTNKEMFEHYPAASGVLMLYSDHIDKLQGWETILGANHLNHLKEAAKKQTAFVYAIRRSPIAYLFIFVGKDEAALKQAINGFIQIEDITKNIRYF